MTLLSIKKWPKMLEKRHLEKKKPFKAGGLTSKGAE